MAREDDLLQNQDMISKHAINIPKRLILRAQGKKISIC